MKEKFLQPGEIIFSSNPMLVTTILGSCVSVCIFDKVKKIGGICHYYLPTADRMGVDDRNKYAEYAIPNLLREFKNVRSNQLDLTAKIIGGGYVIESLEIKDVHVGSENIKAAIRILEKFSINIESRAIGGSSGKKVRFETHTGILRWKEVEKGVQKQKIKKIEKRKIGIMIVDDSAPIRKILRRMLEVNPEFEIIHEARDAFHAQKLMRDKMPDVITMDINMPGMDGVSFLGQYMKKTPVPTIMVSSLGQPESGPIFDALELGAFDYVQKPQFSEIESMTPDLHEKVKAAFLSGKKLRKKDIVSGKVDITLSSSLLSTWIVAIGASTGGTEAIRDILIRLPRDIPPIVIVQHIPPIFSKAFADRMNQLCSFEVKEACNGDEPRAGLALIAPGGKQMKLEQKGEKVRISITDDPPVNRFKPSVDYLFNSVSRIAGRKLVGILLTGMGNDGANGLLEIRKRGVLTIAQNEESSVVFGMPKAAIELNAASKVASLHNIPSLLAKNLV